MYLRYLLCFYGVSDLLWHIFLSGVAIATKFILTRSKIRASFLHDQSGEKLHGTMDLISAPHTACHGANRKCVWRYIWKGALSNRVQRKKVVEFKVKKDFKNYWFYSLNIRLLCWSLPSPMQFYFFLGGRVRFWGVVSISFHKWYWFHRILSGVFFSHPLAYILTFSFLFLPFALLPFVPLFPWGIRRGMWRNQWSASLALEEDPLHHSMCYRAS